MMGHVYQANHHKVSRGIEQQSCLQDYTYNAAELLVPVARTIPGVDRARARRPAGSPGGYTVG